MFNYPYPFNMFKKLFFFALLVAMIKVSSAQSLRHSFGETVSVMHGTMQDQYYQQDLTLIQSNLSYFPRLSFLETEKTSLSIGVPLGIGFGMYSDTYASDEGLYFSFDVPVVLDFNIGCNSSKENTNGFGGFVGVGFGFQKVSISQTEYVDYNGESYGPMIRGGVRFRGSSRWRTKSITISSFYKMGMENEKFKTVGLSAFFDL